jgi:6-phosphogluconolactonase
MTQNLRSICLVASVCALLLLFAVVQPQTTLGQGHGTGPLNEFVYVADGSETIEAFQIDGNGALTTVPGSPFSAGIQPIGITTSPSGLELYAPDLQSNDVLGYAITGGVLSPASGSPFPAGTEPATAAIDPVKSLLFVANCGSSCFGAGTGSVSAYLINHSTGALTQVRGSPFAAGSSSLRITVDPSGRFVYVTNYGSANVSAFSIGKAGALTPIAGSPFATGSGPIGVAVDPSGQFLYVANNGSNDISAFSIDTDNGSLMPIGGSPFSAGSFPDIITVDAMGKYLYMTANDGLEGYSISSSGALAPLAGSPFNTGGPTTWVAIDGSNHFLYATNYSFTEPGTLVAFTLDTLTGALSPVNGSPYTLAGMFPSGLTTSPRPASGSRN